MLGFRRAFCITSVWRHDDGTYGMHAGTEPFDPTDRPFNTGTAPTFRQ